MTLLYNLNIIANNEINQIFQRLEIWNLLIDLLNLTEYWQRQIPKLR